MLGLLQVDLNQPDKARQSLAQHVALAKDSTDAEQQAGLTEALMVLSQLAESTPRVRIQSKRVSRMTLSAISATACSLRRERGLVVMGQSSCVVGKGVSENSCSTGTASSSARRASVPCSAG